MWQRLFNNQCCRWYHVWRWNHVWKFHCNSRNETVNLDYAIMKKIKFHVMLKCWHSDKTIKARECCDKAFRNCITLLPETSSRNGLVCSQRRSSFMTMDVALPKKPREQDALTNLFHLLLSLPCDTYKKCKLKYSVSCITALQISA